MIINVAHRTCVNFEILRFSGKRREKRGIREGQVISLARSSHAHTGSSKSTPKWLVLKTRASSLLLRASESTLRAN